MEINKNSLIVGCNYHTTWQINKAMRFVLKEIQGDDVRLYTRHTQSDFWTNKDNLIFIMSKHNIKKAEKLLSK